MNKKKLVVGVGLGLTQLALLNVVALGQERPASQKSLDEVVLVASRSPRKQAEIGKVVRVIDSAQLAKSQGRTLPELLSNVAGLAVSGSQNAPGANITVFTRGAAAGNTLILIDGIPANNASYISGDYDISSLAIEQIERIEILKGVNSTLYGSDAVAGVINIITKQPQKQKIGGSLLATGGTYGTFKQAAEVNGTLNKTGISLTASNSNSDGFSVAKDKTGSGNFDLDGFRQQAVNAHLKQQVTDKFSLQANLQLNRNTFDLDAGAYTDDKDYTAKNSSFFGGLNAKFDLPKGALTLIYNQNNVRNQFNDPGAGTNFSRQDNKGKVYYGEAILTDQLATGLGITAGVNYRDAETSQTYESMSSFGPYNSYLDYGTAKNNIISTYSSLFFKKEGFNFELGGRFNHHSQYKNNFTYTINPSYVFDGRYKIFAGVASAFKVPSLYQLNSSYKNVNGLDPETTTSYEAGTELELAEKKLTLDVSAFIRDAHNVIYFYTDPVTFGSTYRNGNKQHDKGFEIEVNATPADQLTFSAWYAYVKGRGTDASGSTADFLLRRPENTFGATAGYAFNTKISANLSYKYTGNRLDPFGYPTVNLNQHAYTWVDAYLQVKPVAKLMLFADIKNLFNEGYTEWEGYNTRGRNFNAGAKYSF